MEFVAQSHSKSNYELDFLQAIDEVGYVILPTIPSQQLSVINCLVFESFREILNANGWIGSTPINFYHKNPLPSHSSVWTKRNRTLSSTAASTLLELDYIKSILKRFAYKYVTDEQKLGYPNLYYRLVRPGKTDIGSFHADSWFWKLDDIKLSPSDRRLKCWIPLVTGGEDAFAFIPKSHSRASRYEWKTIERHGQKKPFLVTEITEELSLHGREEGTPIIFDDDLIHGGKSVSDLTRVSIEFTFVI